MPGGTEVFAGLVAFSLFKKATVYGVARYYGFPKLYRKLVRFNLRVNPTSAQNSRVLDLTKRLMRLPNHLLGAKAVRVYRKAAPKTQPTAPATSPLRPQVDPRTRM